MRRETAYKIAIDTLTKEARNLAFEKNLAEYYGNDGSSAAEKLRRITEAIEILRREP